MLIQFEKSSRTALWGNDMRPGSHMREGASRNPAIQLRADPPRLLVPVAPSRVEETTTHQSFLSRCGAALIDIAAVFAIVLLVLATGVGIAFAGFVLLFCSL